MRLNTIQKLPSPSFFRGVTSKNAEIYIDCLDILCTKNQGLSYRIPYGDAIDSIKDYLFETKAVMVAEEDGTTFSEPLLKRPGEILSIFLKFGWIRKEMEEGSFDEVVYVTKEARILHTMCHDIDDPPKVEFSNIIIRIYTLLHSRSTWEENPYVHFLKPVYQGVSDLSEALMEMNTYISETAKEMQASKTYSDITSNFIGFTEADFPVEFHRLSSQSIALYRYGTDKEEGIVDGVQKIRDSEMKTKIIEECMQEEKKDYFSAANTVDDMFDIILDFMMRGYEEIYIAIKSKISHYIEVLTGRLRYLKRLHSVDFDKDIRNALEITRIRLEENMDLSDTDSIFTLYRQELLDPAQTIKERKNHVVKTQVVQKVERLSKKDKERLVKELEEKAVSLFDRDHVGRFIKEQMHGTKVMHSWDVQLNTLENYLYTMASAMYAYILGYEMEVEDDYSQSDKYIVRRFTIREKEAFHDPHAEGV